MLLGVICAVLLVACGGDDDEPRADPTTTAPTTTQSQEQEDEEALRQLAEDWYETSDAIYQHRADPETAQRYLVDPYLTAYTDRATDLVESGQVSRPSDVSRQEILDVVVAGDSAVVTECAIDADVLVGPNGEVIDDEVYAQLLESDATRGPDGWRFSDRRLLVEDEGSDQCPSP